MPRFITSLVLLAMAIPLHADEVKLDYSEKTLANGLRVVTLEDFSCPIVSVQVWYHVGSKDENPERQGFAHMFEHMMFRGTDLLGPKSHFELIRKVGGDCNAYTSFDQTVYTNKLPSNQLDLVLWLESERMAFLKIDQTSFDTERAVVEEERRIGLNGPYGGVLEKALREIFTTSHYRWSTIGSIPHLRRASIDELSKFWETYYVPNNATLVIAGAVKSEDAQKLAERYFGWIPAGEKPPVQTATDAPQTQAKQISISEPKAPVTIIGLGFRTAPQSDPDVVALAVLTQAIGGGESSRIYREMVKEKDLVVAAGAGSFDLELDGIAAVFGIVKPFGDKDKVAAELKSQVERVVKDGITDDELVKSKTELLKSQVAGSKTVESKATLIGTYAVLMHDLSRLNQRAAEINAVTKENAQRVAKRFFNPQGMNTVVVEQSFGELLKTLVKGKEDEGAAPTTKSMENRIAVRTGPKASAVRPAGYPTTAPIAPLLAELPKPQTTEQTLPNGLKVVTIYNDELPLVTISLGLKNGAFTEAPDAYGAASMAATMITQGTQNYTSQQLADELERNAISLGGSMSMDVGGVNANCLTDKADLAMKLLAEVVCRPTFPQKDFDRVKQQTLTGLAVSAQTPTYLADREFSKRLYGDFAYGRTEGGDAADVKKLTPELVGGWWKTNVNPQSAVLYFAGKITPEAASELAKKYLGDWSSSGKIGSPTGTVPARSGTHIYLVNKPGNIQSEIRVGQVGISRTSPDYAASRVLSQYFGGSFNSRLFQSLRGEKGLTYGAYGGFGTERFAGTFEMSTNTKTSTTADAVKALLTEVKRLADVPPTDQESGESRSFLVGKFAGDRETPESTIQDLWLIEYSGLPKDFFQQTLKQIGETTNDQLVGVATKVIDPATLTIVVVGDAKAVKDDLEKIAPVTVIEPDAKPTTNAAK